jgi:Predicted integral membrane protein (DUF2269)
MLYELLRLGHLIGLILIGAGLIGVFLADIRTRQASTLPVFAEAVRNIALFYDGLVVPGALLLLGSGTWLIIAYYDGWAFLQVPWLAGMVLLFAFEFVEGNIITRLYFLKLRRLSLEALRQGDFTAELARVRAEPVPTFTHFLDLPILLLIVSLGALRPDTWTHFLVGAAVAIAVALALTLALPRLYTAEPMPAAARSRGKREEIKPTKGFSSE